MDKGRSRALASVLAVVFLCSIFSGSLVASLAYASANSGHYTPYDFSQVSSEEIPAEPVSADDAAVVNASDCDMSRVTYRTIDDRQDALGVHPVLMENPAARDPSYSELVTFLSHDNTVNNKYDNPNFTCADFAVELQHHAEQQGLNCGYASLKFMGKESGHAVDVFDTVDEGAVFVDTTGGKTIVSKDLQPGEQYYNLGIIADVTDYW